MRQPPRRLRLLPLLATIYFCVSGGPFGLEQTMQSGAGLGLLLILLTPFIWAAPAAMMTAELASAIPEEGGYYIWAKRALGPFWGFLCGWWTWLYSWVDCALYPTLFAGYVSSLLNLYGHDLQLDNHGILKWAIGLVVIIPFTWLNIRGTKQVGQSALWMVGLLLAPFLVMVCLGIPLLIAHPARAVQPFVPHGQSLGAAFNSGLFVVMWNYLGWDSMSTVAGEVENPQRAFPRALAIGIPLVLASYLLPTLIGIVAVPDPSAWQESSWPTIVAAVGGRWLAVWVTIAGLIGAAGLFSATLLAASRIPFVIAEDGFLPSWLTRLHPRFGTPTAAILISAAIYTILSFKSFASLEVLDVTIYSSALLIEFAALLALRKKAPDMPRPYRIPGGWFGVVLVALLPTAMIVFAVVNQAHEEGIGAIWWAVAALATGPLIYGCRLLFGKPFVTEGPRVG